MRLASACYCRAPKFRGKVFPRVRVCVSSSPFQRGHPATPRCRLRPDFSSASVRGHRSGASAQVPAPVHSLRSETAWLRAHGRLWRFVVRARPFARIALVAGSVRDTGGLAAPPPAPTPPFAHGLSPALRSRNCAMTPPARNDGSWLARLRHPWFGYAQTPLGLRCSLSLRRSPIFF